MNGVIFKNNESLKYYKKLNTLLEEGFIYSFNLDSLSINQTKSKYGANKIDINDIKFDSMLEANYYLHLLKEKAQGTIINFDLKPSFILQPSFKKNEKKYHPIKYIADFSVSLPSGETLIIDTKGVITPDFKIKQKLFEYTHPHLALKVIKYVESYGGWIEYDYWLKEKNKRKKEKKKPYSLLKSFRKGEKIMSENRNVFKMLLEGANKKRAQTATSDKLNSILNNAETRDYENRSTGHSSDDSFSDFSDFSVGEERDKVDHLSDVDKLSLKELDKKSLKEQLKILKIEYNRLYDKLSFMNESASNNERLISDLQMERRADEEEVRQMKNLVRKIVHLFPGQGDLKSVVDRGLWKVDDVFEDIEGLVVKLLNRLKETDDIIEQEIGKVRDENSALKEKLLQYKAYFKKITELEEMILQQQNSTVQAHNPQSAPYNAPSPSELTPRDEDSDELLNETENNLLSPDEEVPETGSFESNEEVQENTAEHSPHFSDFFNEFTASFNKMKEDEKKEVLKQTDVVKETPELVDVSPKSVGDLKPDFVEKKSSPIPPSAEPSKKKPEPQETKAATKHPLSPDYVETEKEEVDDLFDDSIDAYLQNLSVQQEFLMTVIGKTGISRNSDLKEYLKEDSLGQQYYFVGKKYNSNALNRDIAELRDKSILNDEQVSYGGKGGGTFNVYELSKTGKSCFKKITNDNPVVPEKKRIVGHHASLEHGYLIKDSAKIFREMVYKVYTDLEDVSIKIDPKHRKVFDFIVEDEEGKLMHIEVERGTHTQEGFSDAMDKIYEITKDFYFICPNEQVKNKNTKKKFFTWVTKTLGGIQNADVTLNMTTIEQLRKKPKNLWEVTDLRNVK
ncbi:hypothetical protein C1N73_29730 (plasmid) [Priestia aryabhattai]